MCYATSSKPFWAFLLVKHKHARRSIEIYMHACIWSVKNCQLCYKGAWHITIIAERADDVIPSIAFYRDFSISLGQGGREFFSPELSPLAPHLQSHSLKVFKIWLAWTTFSMFFRVYRLVETTVLSLFCNPNKRNGNILYPITRFGWTRALWQLKQTL